MGRLFSEYIPRLRRAVRLGSGRPSLECGDWSPLSLVDAAENRSARHVTKRLEKESDDKSSHSKRAALTLLEVLISIFVLAVGLLGVAALLPLGQREVQRGAIDQRAADLAEKAVGSLETYGVIDPTRWMTHDMKFFDAVDPSTGTRVPCPVIDASLTTIKTDYKRLLHVSQQTNLAGCYVEFVTGKLRGMSRRVSSYAFGAFTFNGAASAQNGPLPAVPDVGDVFVVIRNQAFAIDPYFVAVHGIQTVADGPEALFAEGVPRITLTRSEVPEVVDDQLYAYRMGFAMAESVFVADDEEIFEKPVDADEPLAAMFYSESYTDSNNNGKWDTGETYTDDNGNSQFDGALKRKFQGDFSWLATFVPGEGGIYARDYTVSIAVFYKRNIRSAADQRSVDVRFTTQGNNLGGGTVILSGDIFEDMNGNGTYEQQIDKLRFAPQQWLLVANRRREHDVNPSDMPKKVYRWYRIAAVSDAWPGPQGAGTWGVDVQLVGADWDTDLLGGYVPNATDPSEAMATVYDNLIGVFQRQVRVKSLPVGTTN